MKRKIMSFVTGAVAMLVISSTAVTALAASGAIKIEVSPISILVDGEVFQPRDAKGNDVMVFSYNGTTYAPLRALAEAYGLEVGYDSEKHIATVNKPSTQAQPSAPTVSTDYAAFETQWTITEKPVTKYLVFFKARDADALTAAFKEYTADTVKKRNRQSVLQKLRSFVPQSRDQAKEKKRELER